MIFAVGLAAALAVSGVSAQYTFKTLADDRAAGRQVFIPLTLGEKQQVISNVENLMKA
eukprot:jgi/Hompol1/5634/HPOL_004581-RA